MKKTYIFFIPIAALMMLFSQAFAYEYALSITFEGEKAEILFDVAEKLNCASRAGHVTETAKQCTINLSCSHYSSTGEYEVDEKYECTIKGEGGEIDLLDDTQILIRKDIFPRLLKYYPDEASLEFSAQLEADLPCYEYDDDYLACSVE